MTENGAPAAPPAQAAAGTRSANDFRREQNGPVGPNRRRSRRDATFYNEVKHMPRLEKIGRKLSAPSKILHMALPDEETLAFWKMTADDPHEYAARIARFSRAVGKWGD